MEPDEKNTIHIVISGPQGIGKTHLVEHVLVPALEAAGIPYAYTDDGFTVRNKMGKKQPPERVVVIRTTNEGER